jgi:hypothetical protein
MPVMPVGRNRLAYQHRIEPAAAALAARDRAEFMARVAEELADLVLQLGRERAFADAGRVGLGDAEHIAERPGRCRNRRRLAGNRVRRGDEGIGAVVDVEQRALRAFEQDARAGLARLSSTLPHRLA